MHQPEESKIRRPDPIGVTTDIAAHDGARAQSSQAPPVSGVFLFVNQTTLSVVFQSKSALRNYP